MNEEQEETDFARAFGEGCDARLAGEPLWLNPYSPGTRQYYRWRLGWNDVDLHWGTWVKGRWRYAPLTEVLDHAS